LQRAYNKYGELKFSVLIICGEENLFFYEQIFLDKLLPEYNISPSACGTRGLKWSEESKAKLRASLPKKDGALISASILALVPPEERILRAKKARSAWTDESKASQIANLTGRKDSPETVQKKVAKLTGRPVSEETRAKLALQAGWKHSEESKAKMRGRVVGEKQLIEMAERAKGNTNRLGAVIPKEMRDCISAKLKGKPRTPESIAKQKASWEAKRLAKTASATK
jgi:hypothetical protein